MNYTYLVECADKTLYCGWTNDLKKRLAAHNAGTGAKYTKPRRPVALGYFETFDTKEEAMRREAAIKRLGRKEKLALIEARNEEETEERLEGQPEERPGGQAGEAAAPRNGIQKEETKL